MRPGPKLRKEEVIILGGNQMAEVLACYHANLGGYCCGNIANTTGIQRKLGIFENFVHAGWASYRIDHKWNIFVIP